MLAGQHVPNAEDRLPTDLRDALAQLAQQVGASQIVMGRDFPFPWTKVAVDHILNTSGLSDDDKRGMLGETAAKLLKLLSRRLRCLQPEHPRRVETEDRGLLLVAQRLGGEDVLHRLL